MQNILDKKPWLGDQDDGVEVIYQMARGNKYQDQSQMAQNEDFVNQILNNPDNKQKIIAEYLQGVNRGEQPPVVIAGQAGGNMQITPEARPKTMDEVNTAVRKLFGA